MKVYAVIIEDKHSATDVTLFKTWNDARQEAAFELQDFAFVKKHWSWNMTEEELKKTGWVFYQSRNGSTTPRCPRSGMD